MASIKNLFKELGNYKKRKSWYNFCCPFHHGSKHNFGVNLESRWFKCYGCGESGPLAELPGRLRKGSSGSWGTELFGDISEWQKNTSGVQEAPKKIQTEVWMGKHYTPVQYSGGQIMDRKAIKYLHSRAVPEGYPVGFLDTEPTKIVFPFYRKGIPVYWVGREILGQPIKTKNPSEAQGWLPKSKVLWNIDSLYHQDTIVLCEGIFDAIAVEVKSELPATCILGSSISKHQISLVKKCGVRKVIVFMDADAYLSGIEIAIKLYKSGLWAFYVNGWSEGEVKSKLDPSDMSMKQVCEKIVEADEVSHLTELQFLSGFY